MPTNRTAQGKWKTFRTRVIREAGRDPACHYCGIVLDPGASRGEPDAIELDHVLPVITHPHLEYDRTNIVLACHPCNRSKGKRAAPGQSEPATPPPRTYVTWRTW